MSLNKIRKNPKGWIAAAVATSVIAITLQVYNSYIGAKDKDDVESTVEDAQKPGLERKRSRKYTNKSIALTLSHSILSSQLPLNDILLNSENVTFILPPNLSLDDLEFNMEKDTERGGAQGEGQGQDRDQSYNLPRSLIQNYKLLNCLNLQGYFNILKNLKPDMLLVCSDDLGIAKRIPHDIDTFVKEIVNIDQNKEDIYSKVRPIFFN